MAEETGLTWESQLRRLLGGMQGDPLGLDGAVGQYQTIARDSRAYLVLYVKFPDGILPSQAGMLVGAVATCLGDDEKNPVHYECTADGQGNAILLLESGEPKLLRDSSVRALAGGVTMLMERETGAELRIGIGSVCKSPVFIPFSKADAVRNLTRYNVSKTIESVITYISINYSDPELSVGQIAKDNFLNYSYLCTQFRREVGMSPGKFIQQFRMRTAADLLTIPNHNVLEVARTVGFGDVKYFSKCFKTAYGISPNLYRLRQREKREKLMEKIENPVVNYVGTEYNTEE